MSSRFAKVDPTPLLAFIKVPDEGLSAVTDDSQPSD